MRNYVNDYDCDNAQHPLHYLNSKVSACWIVQKCLKSSICIKNNLLLLSLLDAYWHVNMDDTSYDWVCFKYSEAFIKKVDDDW